MAQFRATIQGIRGEASRLGTKSSGLTANINGWDIGVEVHIEYNETEKRDIITLYQTAGSNGSSATKLIKTIKGPKSKQ